MDSLSLIDLCDNIICKYKHSILNRRKERHDSLPRQSKQAGSADIWSW